MKRWLVFNIGCIECGVSSNVVGMFSNGDEAERVARFLEEKHGWREGGQNHYEVFDLKEKQAEEYAEVLAEMPKAEVSVQ